jgi:predicted metal-dependent phosphoesterase TrpH
MKLDPHIHSYYSRDSQSHPIEILKRSEKIGLDFIAISDHNTIKGSKIAIEESKKVGKVKVIPSIEISSLKGHILGFGIEEEVPKGLSPEETIDKIHDLGGLSIIPHPFTFYRNGLFSKTKHDNLRYDAIETLNGRFIIGYGNHKAKKLSIKKNIPEIGASDSHFIESIGDCYTELDCDNVDDVIIAIKKNKTKAMGKGTSNYLIGKEFINKKIKRIY